VADYVPDILSAFANALANPIKYQSELEKREKQLSILTDEIDESNEVRVHFIVHFAGSDLDIFVSPVLTCRIIQILSRWKTPGSGNETRATKEIRVSKWLIICQLLKPHPTGIRVTITNCRLRRPSISRPRIVRDHLMEVNLFPVNLTSFARNRTSRLHENENSRLSTNEWFGRLFRITVQSQRFDVHGGIGAGRVGRRGRIL
jgi:hypothetical protein